MSRQRKLEPPPNPFPRVEVFSKHGPDGDLGGEDTRGADGKPVYPGRMVKVPEHFSERLGHTIPLRFGTVQKMYRVEGVKCPETGCEIMVEAWERGVRYFWLSEVRRSARQTEETKADKAAQLKAAKEAA